MKPHALAALLLAAACAKQEPPEPQETPAAHLPRIHYFSMGRT